jgi:hypothetical protein
VIKVNRQVLYTLGVYLVEVAVVVGYVVGWLPVHPIVLLLPLVGVINYKVERKGLKGLGIVIIRSYCTLLLTLVYGVLKLSENLILLQLEGMALNFNALWGGSLGSLLKTLAIAIFIIAFRKRLSPGGISKLACNKPGVCGVW